MADDAGIQHKVLVVQENDVANLPYSSPDEHHHIAKSQNSRDCIDIKNYLTANKEDPAFDVSATDFDVGARN